MEHVRDILLTHAARYPKMQPTDAVKLLFQSEFGGGHLVANEERFRAYLRAEYEQTYGPLTINGNNDPDAWRWADGPWPWEKEA